MLLGVHVRNVKVRPGPLATVVLTGHLAHDARKYYYVSYPIHHAQTFSVCIHYFLFTRNLVG